MSTPSSVRRRQFAMGVALLGCSFASTERLHATPPPGLLYGDMTSFSLTGSATRNSTTVNGTPVTFSGNTAGAYWSDSTTVSDNNAGPGFQLTLEGYAYHANFGSPVYDTVLFRIGAGAFYSAFVGSVTFVIDFSVNVTFDEFIGAGSLMNWTMDGNVLNDGDLVLAGVRTFTANFSNLASTHGYSSGSANFLYHSSAAVPLPGAAGLAACGLLGLARRRRR